MSREIRDEDFYRVNAVRALEHVRARKERARRRADASHYFAATSLLVSVFAGVVVLGFYAMAWGMVPVAFVCWLAGGASMLLFGLFWIGAVREWVRTR